VTISDWWVVMLLVIHPETCVEVFGLSCIIWIISDRCLGIADGSISVLHVSRALSGL